jgi:hypothetical protein
MKLVFHDKLTEEEWITHLCGEAVSQVIYDSEYSIKHGDAIHAVSGHASGTKHLRHLTEYFKQCRRNAKNLTLIHASDEYFSGGYEIYRYFDRVIRTHETWLARAPGIITIPLGIPNGNFGPAAFPSAGNRRYVWSFAGQVKASRREMVRDLRCLGPNYVIDTLAGRPLHGQEYHQLLSDSIFLPCPMGNVMLETWRLYEGLEFGCIPIVEKRRTINYYRNLFGPNPLPAYNSWREARIAMDDMLSKPELVFDTQAKISSWWRVTKEEYKQKVAMFLQQPSQIGSLLSFSAFPRNRNHAFHKFFSTIELIRHQTSMSLARRLAAPLGTMAPMRRETGRVTAH